MRRKFFSFLCLFFLACVLAQAFSQSGLTATSGTTLGELFKRLEQQYGYSVAFDDQLDLTRTLSAFPADEDIEAYLQRVMPQVDLEYQIFNGNQILIRSDLYPEDTFTQQPGPSRFILVGSITDAASGEPVQYANIVFLPSQSGTVSREDGTFSYSTSLTRPAALQVQYVGYETVRKSLIDSPDTLRIALHPTMVTIPTVWVHARTIAGNEPRLSLNSTELPAAMGASLSYQLGASDLMKGFQMLPGVQAYDDFSAGLRIRGAGTDETGIFLDGIPLLHVDHFYGIFSAINSQMVESAQLMTNAYSSEYGGRTAGMLDIQSLELLEKSPELRIEVSNLMSSAVVSAPFSKSAGMLFSARLTNNNLANSKFFDFSRNRNTLPSEDELAPVFRRLLLQAYPDFRFYDLYGKLTVQPHEKVTLEANGFLSRDDFENVNSGRFGVRINNQYRNNAHLTELGEWDNAGWSARGTIEWNPMAHTVLSVSGTEFSQDSWLSSELEILSKNGTDSRSFSNLGLNDVSSRYISLKHSIPAGDHNRIDFGYNFEDHRTYLNLMIDDQSILDNRDNTSQHSLFLQYQGRHDKELAFSGGLRLIFDENSTDFFISPRLSLTYTLDDAWDISLAAARYHQFLRQTYHEDRFGRAEDYWIAAQDMIPHSSSFHLIGGLNYNSNSFDMSVEPYYIRTEGVIEHALMNIGFSTTEGEPSRDLRYIFFEGDREVTGVDVLLSKKIGLYEGSLAYTLSQSRNTFPEINRGQPFPAQNDRRHQFKLVNQFTAGKFTFNANGVFTSGRPYTDLSMIRNDPQDRTQLRVRQRISWLDDYVRLDLGARFDFNLLGNEAAAGISVFNVLDRRNVKYAQYFYSVKTPDPRQPDATTIVGNEVYMLDRTFTLYFNWNLGKSG